MRGTFNGFTLSAFDTFQITFVTYQMAAIDV